MGWSSWGMDLVSLVLGKFAKGLMVFGAAEYIRLLESPGTHFLNILAGSGRMVKLGNLRPGFYA